MWSTIWTFILQRELHEPYLEFWITISHLKLNYFLRSNVFKCSKRDWLCFFRQVWTKCESWLMRSTPTWTLPFLLSPWQWWRSLTKMAPGFGTHISVTWRQIFLILFFFFYKCQTFLLNALNNVGGGITKQTTVSPSAVCVCQESRSLLLEALRQSQNEDFCLGVKLVRGAYMDKERRLAEEEGRLDPIHKSWEDTNDRWIGGSGQLITTRQTHPRQWQNIKYTRFNLTLVWVCSVCLESC